MLLRVEIVMMGDFEFVHHLEGVIRKVLEIGEKIVIYRAWLTQVNKWPIVLIECSAFGKSMKDEIIIIKTHTHTHTQTHTVLEIMVNI